MKNMIKDVMLFGPELQAEFRGTKEGTEMIGEVEFVLDVLTIGNWPIDVTPTCIIPPPMKKCTSDFELFYKAKHAKKNLTWVYNHGHVEV